MNILTFILSMVALVWGYDLLFFSLIIITLILCFKNIKIKGILNIIILILAIIVLAINIAARTVYVKKVSDNIKQVSNSTYEQIELRVKQHSDAYFAEQEITKGTYNTSVIINVDTLPMNEPEFNNENCKGYVIYNSESKSTPYISCRNYQTSGYDESLLP